MAAIKKIPAGDVLLLHGCCHNPTGIDPTPEQWKKLADVIYERGILPLLDFAYQGFADGIDEDAVGLKALARPGAELIVCSSFSKNFGLYCERVGALTIVAKDKKAADTVQSQVKVTIRSNYSNPPAHGAELVATVLGDPELAQTLARRSRPDARPHQRHAQAAGRNAQGQGRPRRLFVHHPPARHVLLLRPHAASTSKALKEKYAIYIVGSGRINVAGITEDNVGPLCEAIAEVVKG